MTRIPLACACCINSAKSASEAASAAADRANAAADIAESVSVDVVAIKKVLQDVLVVV